jgi:hypothetical protein
MGDTDGTNAGILRQLDPHIDGLVGRVMSQPVIAIHHRAARSADIDLELRVLVEPPASQHVAVMLGQPHPMTVDAHQRRMQHRPGRRRQ